MRKNALTLCCTACVFGAFGVFSRWIQGMTAFEANGLYKPGSFWGIVLILMYLAAFGTIGGFTLYYMRRSSWPRRRTSALPRLATGALRSRWPPQSRF